MSILLNKLNILFIILVFKSFHLTAAAPIYYDDYNSSDINDKDVKDYWEYYQPNSNEPSSKGEYNFQECKPISHPTAATTPSTTPCSRASSEKPNAAEGEDVVDHVIKILRAMRKHAVALIRNMNLLEIDILSSPSSNLEDIYKNSTNALSETLSGMEKIIYPDVLSQMPGYVTKEWSDPMKIDIPDSDQTNEFVAEAQEAVKSWKQQIETCKNILDNAVHNALQQANLKSNLISDVKARENIKTVESNSKYPSSSLYEIVNPATEGFKQLSRDLKQEQRKIQRSRSNKKHKYISLYDAFSTKETDY